MGPRECINDDLQERGWYLWTRFLLHIATRDEGDQVFGSLVYNIKGRNAVITVLLADPTRKMPTKEPLFNASTPRS